MSASEETSPATSRRGAKWRWIAGSIAVVVLIVVAVRLLPGALEKKDAGASAGDPPDSSGLQLTSVQPPIVKMPAEMVLRLGVKTAEVEPYSSPRTLKLDGTLMVDPSNMARVHSRFPGEIMEMGPSDPGNPKSQPIRFGDRVEKEQLIAVVWCKDLGEKKSEFVDAILHLRLDDETLARLRDLAQKGATPDQTVRQAEYTRQSDWIARSRAERTLRSWRLTDEEIQALEKEADAIGAGLTASSPKAQRDWSRVEVRSPISGVVVEMNTGVGDIIDTTLDVIKVANLNRLRVLCQVYEEDLPALQELKPEERKWTIQIGADANRKPLSGQFSFDQIGRIIDPSQHTGQVLGWIDNPDDRLLIGQFVTATVSLPAPKNLVSVPAAAVVENGGGATVFVRHGKDQDWQFEERPVALAGHGTEKFLGIVKTPSQEQQQRGIKPLEPHENVMVDGVLQLSAALQDLRAEAAAKTASQN
ncbi:MAG TPA: efflux RND transporter periplasmic adaptor subunit [Pirellulales bacterium]|nr:efflux RND transporter periplasmic adaptor subunit [Pirellulales bacterium]